MNETPETIRRKMNETKSQLADKLESLEQQVSETFQSTGSAVNSTAEAVQETFETVTGAVQDVVHSVTNALDVRRQIVRHPWLVLGGAVVVGYLAVEFLAVAKRNTKQPPQTLLPTSDSASNPTVESNKLAADPASATTVAAACESRREKSSWNKLTDATVGALIGIVPTIASRIVNRTVDQLIGNLDGSRTDSSENKGKSPECSSRRKESSEAAERFCIASSENVRSRESF